MDGAGMLSQFGPKIKTIVIGRPCKHSSKEWRALGERIGGHKNLEKLIFCRLFADEDDLKDLLTGASRNVSVKEIHFVECNAVEQGGWGPALGTLAAFFDNNPNLTSLYVRNCVLDRDAMRSLTEALGSSPACSLKAVTWISTRIVHDDLARLAASLTGLRNLKMLGIRHSFGPEGWCDEVAGLLRHPRCVLEAVLLSGNEIGDGGLAALQSVITTNNTLRGLHLNGIGEISPTSWLSFFSGLRHPRCVVEKISLSGNEIEDSGLAALASAIAANETLITLYLDRMEGISPAGWRSFFIALRDNRSLKNIHLRDNSIDDNAVATFAYALRGNQRLEKLGLEGNPNITNTGWTFMTKALYGLPSIDSVYESNHTLQLIDAKNTLSLPAHLKYFLRMNARCNINEARRQKIALHFFVIKNCNMLPIRHMNSNVFPHLLSWIGRGSSRLSVMAMYNVLRKMPSLFGNSSRVTRRSKRKRGAGSS